MVGRRGMKARIMAMASQTADDLLHRVEATAHRFGGPLVAELPGRRWVRVLPESLEGLAEQMGLHAPEVVAEQGGELGGLGLREVLRPLEQAPSPYRVHEEHRDVPQRHELEPPRGEPVSAGPRLAALRADRPAIGSGLDSNLKTRVGPFSRRSITAQRSPEGRSSSTNPGEEPQKKRGRAEARSLH